MAHTHTLQTGAAVRSRVEGLVAAHVRNPEDATISALLSY